MFARLRCHYCNKRSDYSKGTTEFQCTHCEAYNFYDLRGNVVDPPEHITTTATHTIQPTYRAPARPLPPDAPRQESSVVCNRCRLNQQIYTESLSNYLPDESHPTYKEFEAKLPQFKEELERRYPLVCTKCASKVQAKIHAADYFSKTQHVAKEVLEKRKRRDASPIAIGQRDDWGKWMMRFLLSLIGVAIYASLLLQMTWHAYGILTALTNTFTTDEVDTTDFAFDPSLEGCAKQILSLRGDTSCYSLLATLLPKALLTSLCLLWYNPGRISWYDPTYRIEAVHGQDNHFRIQATLLFARAIAWFKLSDPAITSTFNTQQLLAAHGFAIVFTILCQWLSKRGISTERWKLRGKIMPKPDEVDVFGETAGPAEESYDRKASSVAPQLRLFPTTNKPFPIENLAPRQTRRGYSKLDLPSMPPPSPPDSHSSDEMDGIESTHATTQRPLLRSVHNYGTTQPLGWGSMRNELFDIEDKSRAAIERKQQEEQERNKLRYQPPVEQSPFRGRLPPAPMSMERRLRNPPTQVAFKKQPLSKQQDFMKQMRDGIENGRGFAPHKQPTPTAATPSALYNSFALDDDFSPVKGRAGSGPSEGIETFPSAKQRTKGSLDLRLSNWRLASDFDNATGLEDIFGGKGFSIADDASVKGARPAVAARSFSFGWLVMGCMAIAGVAALAIESVREHIYGWVVAKVEQLGW
jgi:hypothetical protein